MHYLASLVVTSNRDKSVLWSEDMPVEADTNDGARITALETLRVKHPEFAGHLANVVRLKKVAQASEVENLFESKTKFSPDRLYRYYLIRIWDNTKQPAMFIGLNPSTADETVNDATVRRAINYAKVWGLGGLIMTNAFAYRATSPVALKQIADPVGAENDYWLCELAREAAVVVGAWGNHGQINNRGAAIKALGLPLTILGLTGAGEPKHPLYLKADLKPQPWTT